MIAAIAALKNPRASRLCGSTVKTRDFPSLTAPLVAAAHYSMDLPWGTPPWSVTFTVFAASTSTKIKQNQLKSFPLASQSPRPLSSTMKVFPLSSLLMLLLEKLPYSSNRACFNAEILDFIFHSPLARGRRNVTRTHLVVRCGAPLQQQLRNQGEDIGRNCRS